MTDSKGALAGVHILDLTDERGIYGAKLLADLGADVVRPEPLDGDPLRKRGPHQAGTPEGTTSLWHAFFASNRRFFAVDPSSDEGSEQLRRLVERADIVLACDRSFGVDAADLNAAQTRRPELIVVDTTSFGRDGPWSEYLAPDLVAGALGGFCATTGDVDTPPLKGFGELNFMVSGAYIAIAALGALYHVRQTKVGQRVEVSVHECIASCLEQVFMCYWYDDLLPTTIPGLPRRGSLHWSNGYAVMQAQGGAIMVTPTPDLETQLLWLVQEDAHEDLLDEKYADPENLVETVQRVMEVLRKWVSTREVEELFFEAQSRHSPYGWVLPIEKVAENPQLKARDWWVSYSMGGVETTGPGAPYRFSETPWSLGPYGGPGADGESILADIGWEGAP
ncbi:MAG: CaiB/BaiF CoA-transferase family protein [Gammaproteobacteria bacterium]|nr:CaiB/BaiF CoA-transferase family protein [Gammaproteobacteria bacterium]